MSSWDIRRGTSVHKPRNMCVCVCVTTWGRALQLQPSPWSEAQALSHWPEAKPPTGGSRCQQLRHMTHITWGRLDTLMTQCQLWAPLASLCFVLLLCCPSPWLPALEGKVQAPFLSPLSCVLLWRTTALLTSPMTVTSNHVLKQFTSFCVSPTHSQVLWAGSTCLFHPWRLLRDLHGLCHVLSKQWAKGHAAQPVPLFTLSMSRSNSSSSGTRSCYNWSRQVRALPKNHVCTIARQAHMTV